MDGDSVSSEPRLEGPACIHLFSCTSALAIQRPWLLGPGGRREKMHGAGLPQLRCPGVSGLEQAGASPPVTIPRCRIPLAKHCCPKLLCTGVLQSKS
jgi:hypothetical protein